MALVPLPPKILACRMLAHAHPSLLVELGARIDRHTSLGLITCDQDDSLYAALDHATKFADVDVVFARSFYAGAAHASGPFSGEILGVLAAADPDQIEEGVAALSTALQSEICFYQVGDKGPAFFPHVIAETGRYLSAQAKILPGEPLAYLIAPPLEAQIGLDAALKAADVHMVRYFPAPSETNFAGAYLTGNLPAVQAAAQAFTDAVTDVATHPLYHLRRPNYRRR
ncbi:MAG: ethanolamine utilization microcompartment protein EutL [Myxococcales bacterium]|nr:ethanolamine utilization microcompartment protein EutL [Myxococcales bacterium]